MKKPWAGRKWDIAKQFEAEKKMDLDKIQELRRKVLLIEKDYWITRTRLQPHQLEMLNATAETKIIQIDWEDEIAPKYKYVVMQWWNGVWKSAWLYYTCSLYAIWEYCTELWLPYIGKKKHINIITQSWANVRDYVEPYLLWDWSMARIPPMLIEKIHRWTDHLKWITLKNWCVISIKTVEQWQKRLVWSNPDLLVIDEPIEKDDVWNELLARLRSPQAQMIYWFTPINWYNSSYYFLYEQKSERVRNQTYLRVFKSTLNRTQDHSTLDWLNEKERKMRLYGEFTPLTWLVYNEFDRHNHVIEQFNPKQMLNPKFYAWLDFWTSHPLWFTAIAVDEDWVHYIFDTITWSNILLKDLVKWINELKKKWWIEFEYIVWDSAGKRERIELKELGINVLAADKWSKWANNESNRRAWIMKVNQLLYDNKLFVADTNKELIKEFTTHCYKDWSRDWEVIKENDDILDSMRYVLYSIKTPKYKTEREKKYEDKYWIPLKKKIKKEINSY